MAEGGMRIFAQTEGIREGARQHNNTAGFMSDTNAVQINNTGQLTEGYGLTDMAGDVHHQEMQYMARNIDARILGAQENAQKQNFAANEYDQCSVNVCNVLAT